MAQNPQDWARKLSETIQQRGGKGGGPRFPVGAAVGAVLVGGGYWAINNALFNGERDLLCDPVLLKTLMYSS